MKARNYTKCVVTRDPAELSLYTSGQWLKPSFIDIPTVPKFQLMAGNEQAAHVTRHGLVFAFGMTTPVYLLAGNMATPVQMPNFARNIETHKGSELAVRLWDSIADYCHKAHLHFERGNTKLFHTYMLNYNLACKTFAMLQNAR